MRASLAALEGSPSLASESLDQAMADAEAAPAAPVPVEAPKPQKKRSPNRLVVEEAMNDDNSVPAPSSVVAVKCIAFQLPVSSSSVNSC